MGWSWGEGGPKATFELRVLEPRATIVPKCMVPLVPVITIVPENLISDILVSPPFQIYITPMVNSENGDPCNTFQVPLLPDVPGT